MPFPVSIEYVDRAEEKLGVVFPEAFRARLMLLNGGEISTPDDDWLLYPVLDSSDRKRLSRTCNDIVHETLQLRSSPGFPASAVAIAANGAGDHIVLVPGDGRELSEQPRIWRHETLALEICEIVEGGW